MILFELLKPLRVHSPSAPGRRVGVLRAGTRLLAVSVLLGFSHFVAAQEAPKEAGLAVEAPQPTPIPLADVISQADAVEASLGAKLAASSPVYAGGDDARNLPLLKQEIDTRLAESVPVIQPGALLETLSDHESNWQKLADRLALWARDLTRQANLLDAQIALYPALKATWSKTLEVAQSQSAPPEIRQRIETLLKSITQAEASRQKERAAVLSTQSRLAEQARRVSTALGNIRAAQSAAVSTLFVRDSPPIWNLKTQGDEARDLTWESQASIGAQFTQLWMFAQRQWMHFVWIGLIFGSFVMVLSWVQRGAAKWTDEDPAMKRASLVLQFPVAMAAILSLLVSPPLFEQSPRLLWAILSTFALVPLSIILRGLIERSLFPVLNTLFVFVVLAQIRKIAAAVPELSRLLLLLEMIGGAIFLVWFIRSTRSDAAAATSHKMVRAAARFGLVLLAVIFLADVFGYVRMANYLAAGTLSASYSAILLYAAAVSLAGLIFFALRVRPLSELRLVNHHRALIQQRCTGVLYFAAAVIWALVALGEFSLSVPVLESVATFLNAEMGYGSLQFSLGAVLAFALTLWIAVLLSRFIRFVLEEDVYRRLRLASGPSYAASSLLHYVILLVGFFAAIAALGVDMTQFAVLGGALGVGLGFGLQNIVNNFVSGLILLFERPVNVGDVVQVGDTTGLIQRIGIRASVIRIANSSELIVPNSMLISDKVTNWTLSNRQRRIELQIGVAYGTDPRRVIDLLTSVAVAHPLTARIPIPQTLMTGFGADSLNFEMRLWTNDYDNWMQIKSDVAVAVNEALAAAGIVIPFPQRDLHLQSIDPAVLELLRNASGMKPTLPEGGKLKKEELE